MPSDGVVPGFDPSKDGYSCFASGTESVPVDELALEGREISNRFLERGIGLCIDGHSPEIVNSLLSKDINLAIERHTKGAAMFKAMAVYAPALGMIGTLIGLVQMLSNMSDPAAIGPATSVPDSLR